MPGVGNSSPAAMRRHVVLPQPDGPTMATNSLSRTSKLTSSSAGKSLPSRRNVARHAIENDVAHGRSTIFAAAARPWSRSRNARAPSASDRSSTQAEIAERARVQRGHGGAQVRSRVRVDADQRDFGERELAHVDLASPSPASPTCMTTPPGFTAASAALRVALAPTASMTRSTLLSAGARTCLRDRRSRSRRRAARRFAPQRVGLGDADVAAAVAAQQQRGEQADRAAAQDQHAALGQRPHERPRRGVRSRAARSPRARSARPARDVMSGGNLDHARRRGSSRTRRSRPAASCRSSCGWRTGCCGPARRIRSGRR